MKSSAFPLAERNRRRCLKCVIEPRSLLARRVNPRESAPTSLGEKIALERSPAIKGELGNSSAANQYLKSGERGALSATHCVMYANEARELLTRRVWETDRGFLPVLILIRSTLVLAVDLYLDFDGSWQTPSTLSGPRGDVTPASKSRTRAKIRISSPGGLGLRC